MVTCTRRMQVGGYSWRKKPNVYQLALIFDAELNALGYRSIGCVVFWIYLIFTSERAGHRQVSVRCRLVLGYGKGGLIYSDSLFF